MNENKTFNKAANRPEDNEYYPCKENGATAQSWPSTSPDQIGATVDGEFIWASTHGLARRSVGPAQGVA